MSDEFDYFSESQQNNQTENQVTSTARDNDYEQFNEPSAPTNIQNQIASVQQPNIAGFDDDYNAVSYQPEEVTPEMIEMQRKDEEIHSKLQKKASEQRQLKEKRKEKAKQQLQKLESERKKKIQRNKEDNRSKEENKGKESSNVNPWEKIVENIALKQGQRSGAKNINRMKEVMLKKSKDVLKQ